MITNICFKSNRIITNLYIKVHKLSNCLEPEKYYGQKAQEESKQSNCSESGKILDFKTL